MYVCTAAKQKRLSVHKGVYTLKKRNYYICGLVRMNCIKKYYLIVLCFIYTIYSRIKGYFEERILW